MIELVAWILGIIGTLAVLSAAFLVAFYVLYLIASITERVSDEIDRRL